MSGKSNQRITELLKDLEDPIYWDLAIKGSSRVLQLRQEWDRDTCLQIRDAIIEALKTNRRKVNII